MSVIKPTKRNKNAVAGELNTNKSTVVFSDDSKRRLGHDYGSNHLTLQVNTNEHVNKGPTNLHIEETSFPPYTSPKELSVKDLHNTSQLQNDDKILDTKVFETTDSVPKKGTPVPDSSDKQSCTFISMTTSYSDQYNTKDGNSRTSQPVTYQPVNQINFKFTGDTSIKSFNFKTRTDSNSGKTLSSSSQFQIKAKQQSSSNGELSKDNEQFTIQESSNNPLNASVYTLHNTPKPRRNKNATEVISPKMLHNHKGLSWPGTADKKSESLENDAPWGQNRTADTQDINTRASVANSSNNNKQYSEPIDDIYDHPEWDFLKHINEPKEVGSLDPVKPKRKIETVDAATSGHTQDRTDFPIKDNSVKSHEKSKVMPSRYYETAQTLSALVVEKGLVIKDVFSDGNCLFAAIVDQLRIRRNFTWTAKSLREAAVKYLQDNPYQADGTPLWQFLTEHDGTWDQYLARMKKEGEWGDHFAISALANVLNQRITIMRGYDRLITTRMEPNFPTEPGQSQAANQNGTGTFKGPNTGHSTDDLSGTNERDDICIGHIAEAHYVSLRHVDWEDRFFQDRDNMLEHSAGAVFPDIHLDTLLKYLQGDSFIVPCSAPMSMKDATTSSVGTGVFLGDSFCGLEFMLLNVASDSKTQSKKNYFKDYCLHLTPNDTKVFTDDNTKTSVKDLRAVEEECPFGYTKLSPIQPNMWTSVTCKEDDGTYLKHLSMRDPGEHLRIAFTCSWPECSLGYLTRERPHGWPSPALISKLKQNGVHVVAEASQVSTNPATEWKFSFKAAEKIICTSMNKNMKLCYFFLSSVCEFMFGNKMVLSSAHLKAVFFFTCEEIVRDKFTNAPGYCLLYMLNKLCHYLEAGEMPDYFIENINLLAEIDDQVLTWHKEQLKIFQSHVLECLFRILDRNGLLNWYGLGKCLDMLISDVPRYRLHNDAGTSFRECFILVKIVYIQNLVINHNFNKVRSQYESVFEECTIYYESFNGQDFILQNVLEGLPIQDQWLFAFYMDYVIGSTLLSIVCRNRECTLLDTLFGKDFATELTGTSQTHQLSVSIPTSVVYRENVVSFAELFTRILDNQIDIVLYKLAARYFLKQNTKVILEDIAREEMSGDYHTGHSKMKTNLYNMFTTLYNVYDEEENWQAFSDIMEEYDLLSQHYQHPNLNLHVYNMWKYFGYHEKAKVAWTRYNALTSY